MVNEFLNVISVTFTFVATLGILYLIQKVTIGFLPVFQKVMFRSLSFGDPVFFLTSLVIMINYFDFYKPY